MQERVHVKEILRLALPAIMAGIAEPLIGLVDMAIIGQLGEVSLGAVGLAASFFSLIIWVLSQTKTAISAIVSKHLGKQNLEAVKTLIPQAIWLNFGLGVIIYLFCNVFSMQIFELYEAKGQLLEEADSYFSIRAMGFPLTLSTFLIFGVFRGIQNTVWAMIISIAGGLVNLLFDFALVFGIDGVVAPMGVEGAAIASLIAQLVMFVLAIIYLLKKTTFSIVPRGPFNPLVRKLLGMSGNLFIRTISLNVAYFLANRFATLYGDSYIAAQSVAMQIWLFSAFFIDGFANAGNALSGKLIGAKNLTALRRLSIDLTKLSVVVAGLLALTYVAAYRYIGPLFVDGTSHAITVFNSIFWMVIISQPLNAVAFTFDGIFKGLGETAYLRNTLFFGTLIGFVPVIYFCDYLGWGLHGVWTAFLVWMTVRASTLVIRFFQKYG